MHPSGSSNCKQWFSIACSSISRFRQRVIQPPEDGDSAVWEDDPSFDLHNHLKQIALPPPGDEAALQESSAN